MSDVQVAWGAIGLILIGIIAFLIAVCVLVIFKIVGIAEGFCGGVGLLIVGVLVCLLGAAIEDKKETNNK